MGTDEPLPEVLLQLGLTPLLESALRRDTGDLLHRTAVV